MKTYQLDAFSGVRNDVSPERFDSPHRKTGMTDLLTGTNIELDETGKPYRRLGTTAIDATSTHSLWANDELAYMVRGGTMRQLNPDMSITDLGIPVSGNKVSYRRVGNDVFFSDQLTTGVVGTNGYRPWGIVTPAAPIVTLGAGDLRPGNYLIAITYVRRDGAESGSSPFHMYTLAAYGGFAVTLPISTDPLVNQVRIYLSDGNGELPYKVATLTNSGSTANIVALPQDRDLPLRTNLCGPPPAGQIVGYYKGHTFVAEGAFLWYSLPYQYELFHRATGFMGFTSPIKTFSAVTDGIYIGTEDDVSFLRGDDPAQFSREVKAPYGAVLGTECELPPYYFDDGKNPTPVQLFMTTHGLCVGLDGGQFINLTGGRYVLPDGVATGASLLKVRGESPQLVTSLFP
jgi:hypothetical protein